MNCTHCQLPIQKGQPYARTKRGAHHFNAQQCSSIAPERTYTEAELQEAVKYLEWAFQHAQLDEEATTGEQEDFSDMKQEAWKVIQRLKLTPTTKVDDAIGKEKKDGGD